MGWWQGSPLPSAAAAAQLFREFSGKPAPAEPVLRLVRGSH
jgi:hypothetical protein